MSDDKKDSPLFGLDENGNFSIITSIRQQLELTEGLKIARRYLAMNAFDGILPVIGILMGGIISALVQPIQLVFGTTLLAAVGSSIAMFVSGVSSSYLTELAERRREFRALERSMLSDMSGTAYAVATKTTTRVVSLINGLSPAAAVIITIAPMTLAILGLIPLLESMYLSVLAGVGLLFGLGVFLGKVSGEGKWVYGLKTLATGLILIVIMWLISWFTG
jgi:predicted membrane protein (TIGR00267 family)